MLAVLSVAVLLTAYAETRAAPPARAQGIELPSFVGKLRGSDAFVGIGASSSGQEWLAYVCDSVFYSRWFRGTVNSSLTALELSGSDGALLKLEFGGMNVRQAIEAGRTPSGVFETATGVSLPFETSGSGPNAGLFRSERLEGSGASQRQLLGGWIVVGGEGRGAISIIEQSTGANTERIVGLGPNASETINISAGFAEVQGLGRFDILEVNSAFMNNLQR